MSPDVARELRKAVDGLIRPGMRVGLFGEDAVRALVDHLRKQDLEVLLVNHPGDLESAAVDLMVVAGALERCEWDRWALQQIHRALRDQGHLVLAVRNLFAISTPDGIWFLVRRVIQQLRLRWLRWRRRQRPSRNPFIGRRYTVARLGRTLVSIGYAVEGVSAAGGGLVPRLLATFRRPQADRFAGHFVMICGKRPSLFGVDERRPFPDPEQHRRDFERANRDFLARRDEWLARNGARRLEPPRPLEIGTLENASVLVLSPHPDDEIIGCGGTLAKLIAAEARVTCVQATDGSEAASLWYAPRETRKTIRLREAREVGGALGLAQLVFWEEDNADFRVRPERVQEIRDLLLREQPALIFTPFINDIHPDHVTLSRMLAEAIAGAPPDAIRGRVLCYEVWGLVPANTWCDITEFAKLQENLLLLYPTAMKVDDYVHFCESRNYYNAITLAGGKGFVEAFYEMPAQGFPELFRETSARA